MAEVQRSLWRPGDRVLDLYEVQPVLEKGKPRDAHRGGMGLVYRVRHLAWGVDLAVKAPRPHLFRTEAQKEAFQREAETWIGLGLHPCVVPCHYIRQIDGVPCVFTDYLPGGSLGSWITEGRIYHGGEAAALAAALDVAVQTAWALDHAHCTGVIHGDVKPANILVAAETRVQLADFGLAQARAATGETTVIRQPGHTAVVPGLGGLTYLYASPEQLRGDQLTLATDVWSWAVTVVELFLGKVLWEVGSQARDALAEAGRSQGRIIVPAPVRAVLEHCLEREPGHRPPRMADVAVELQEAYVEVVGAAYPRQEPEAAARLADSLSNQALSFLDLGREGDAEKAWAQALELDPQHPHANYNQGLHWWHRGKITPDQLVERLERVRESHPAAWVDEYLLGLVHLERGDQRRAKAMLTSAYLLAPDNLEVSSAIQAIDALQAAGSASAETSAGKAWADGDDPLKPREHRPRWSYVRPAAADTLTDAARAVRAARARALDLAAVGRFREAGDVLTRARETPGWHRHPELLVAWREVGRSGRRRGLADSWLAAVLPGHAGPVVSVAVTRDGGHALTGSVDGLRWWDLRGGAPVRALGDGASVRTVALSSNGERALSCGEGEGPRVWDTGSGLCFYTLLGHSAPVTAVAVTAKGHIGVSVDGEGGLHVWDLESGVCLQTFRTGVKDPVVALEADGRRAVVAGSVVQAWELVRGVRTWEIDATSSAATSVDVTPGGFTGVVGHRSGELKVIDAQHGRLFGELKGGGPVSAVSVSRDGRNVVSGHPAGSMRVWDRMGGVCLRVSPCEQVRSVAFSADANYVVAGSETGNVSVWELDWKREFHDSVRWYVEADHVLITFLRAHVPWPSEDLGRAEWSDADLAALYNDLQDQGYGWLQPAGVQARLERLFDSARISRS